MPSPTIDQTSGAADIIVDAQSATRCPCGHEMSAHDAIAARFCAATIAGDLQRACVCKPAVEPPAHR
jgi:hypothetical protein